MHCFYNNGSTVYAIVNDRLSALELATTPDVGHDGRANEVTLSYIHERSLFTSRFHLYKKTKVSMETPYKNAFEAKINIFSLSAICIDDMSKILAQPACRKRLTQSWG